MKLLATTLVGLLLSATVHASDWSSLERSVNSVYDCGKIVEGMATQWTEHQKGIVVKCSNSLRYVILKAGENRVAIKPILSDPFVKPDPKQTAQANRLKEIAQAPVPAYK